MRRRRRPFYGYTATSAPHFDTDRPRDGIAGQRHRYKAFFVLDGHARRRGSYGNWPSAALGLLDPPVQHGRVEPTRQCHRRNGYPRLLARADRFSFKMCAMDSSTTTTGLDHLFYSIHVNAYLLRLSVSFHLLRRLNRCLPRPLTNKRTI